MLSLAAAVVDDFDPSRIPRYVAADRDDDLVVHTTLYGDADVLVSDDRHIAPRDLDKPSRYVDTAGTAERVVRAVRLAEFIAEIETSTFALTMIEPGLLVQLQEALARLGPGDARA